MKQLMQRPLLLVIVCLTLFSFTGKPGGEGFEIYLDKQVVIRQFGNDMNVVKAISPRFTPQETITVKYWHCGNAGKDRKLQLRNAQGKTVKEFSYENRGNGGGLLLSTAAIQPFRKTYGDLKIVYLSSEIPSGRVLAKL